MGFRRNATLIRLEYGDDTPFPGLEVRLRSASIGQLMAIVDLVEQVGEDPKVDTEKLAVIRTLCEQFGERLVGWNYEDEDGRPLDATAEVLAGEEPTFVLRLVHDWMQAVQGVTRPLPNGSADGVLPTPNGSPPVDLPMETLPSGLGS